MLTVLVAAVSSVAAIRVSMASQYYNQLSQTAADAGIAYAQSCLAMNNGMPKWTDASPLMPNTDCSGAQIVGFTCPDNNVDIRCALMINGNIKSSFSVGYPDTDSDNQALNLRATGTVSLLRESNNAVWRTYNQVSHLTMSYPNIVTSNLIMKLDASDSKSYAGTGSTWTDLSGNNNSGVLMNGVSYSSDSGGALSFDGGNDYLSVPDNNSLDLTTGVTMETWVNPSSGGATWYGMLSKGNLQNYAMSINSASSFVQFETASGSGVNTANKVVPYGSWTHVVATYDGTTRKVYINGSLVVSDTAVSMIANTESLRIGQGNNNEYFKGKISYVGLYNRALTASEVQQNFHAFSSKYSYNNRVDALVVAGGGSGGGSTGGGGGGGGVLYYTDVKLAANSYPVVVGSGGAAPGNQLPGKNGGNSSFSWMLAIGGGGGACSLSAGVACAAALSGGSGGGGQNYFGTSATGSGTYAQGYAGGALGSVAGSGGGGAGGVGGSSAIANHGGDGGVGLANSISGASVYYGGGGGGASLGIGGLGGGGAAGDVGVTGTANTGGGGGGGWSYASGNGGAGGSGIVIIRYPTGSMTATGGTITTSGGYTIHTFTGNGTFIVN